MGCGPSKKSVELQHNIQMLRWFNESMRNWEDDREKNIQDAICAKERDEAFVKSASTPKEKAWALAELALAEARVDALKKPLAESNNMYRVFMQKRLEREKLVLELVLKNT